MVLPFPVRFRLSPVNFPPLTSKALIQLHLLDLSPLLKKASPEGDRVPVRAWLGGLTWVLATAPYAEGQEDINTPV